MNDRSVADRLNNSKLIGLAIAVFPAYFMVNAWVLRPGGISNLTLNSINALFLLVAILLWTRPTAIVAQMKDSVTNISDIIFQFPFYTGIAGLLTGTGLATLIVEFFGAFEMPATWPVIGVLVAGIVNVFITSGGGQWTATGLIITVSLNMGLDGLLIETAFLGDPKTGMIITVALAVETLFIGVTAVSILLDHLPNHKKVAVPVLFGGLLLIGVTGGILLLGV